MYSKHTHTHIHNSRLKVEAHKRRRRRRRLKRDRLYLDGATHANTHARTYTRKHLLIKLFLFSKRPYNGAGVHDRLPGSQKNQSTLQPSIIYFYRVFFSLRILYSFIAISFVVVYYSVVISVNFIFFFTIIFTFTYCHTEWMCIAQYKTVFVVFDRPSRMAQLHTHKQTKCFIKNRAWNLELQQQQWAYKCNIKNHQSPNNAVELFNNTRRKKLKKKKKQEKAND